MKTWTTHTRDGRDPVLVPEGFSLWAAILGPLWLLAHRAWIPAILYICAAVAIGWLPIDPSWRTALELGLIWSQGLFGQDLRRWSLARAGFRLTGVVAARDHDAALLRFLDARLAPGPSPAAA